MKRIKIKNSYHNNDTFSIKNNNNQDINENLGIIHNVKDKNINNINNIQISKSETTNFIWKNFSFNCDNNFKKWIKINKIEEKISSKLLQKLSKTYEIINEVIEKTPNILVAINGGKDSLVLINVIELVLNIKKTSLNNNKENIIFFIFHDEKNDFKELISFIDIDIKRDYNVNVLKINSSNIKNGLSIIKKKFPKFTSVIQGVRKADPDGKFLDFYSETTGDYPKFLRISPILYWDYHNVWEYILSFKIPYPKLYDQGYTSIGNIKNTKKNQFLKFKNENGKMFYKKAYELKDESKERCGRNNNKKLKK